MSTGLINMLLLEKDKDVQELAMLLADIEKALVSKEITEQEYVQLQIDVERLRAVTMLANDARIDIMVHEAIRGLIQLAKTVW
jgi:hypothetical protein